MIPLSRKPSFPPPPAPPPYHHKRSFKPTGEDFHDLDLQHLGQVQVQRRPTSHAPYRSTNPSPPLPRTPSPPPLPVINVDTTVERTGRQDRPRPSSQDQYPISETRGRPSPSPSQSPTSPTVSTPAYLVPRSTHGAMTAAAPAPPPPSSHSTLHHSWPSEPPISPPPTAPLPSRPRFPSFAVLGLSRATRQATAQITHVAARQAAGEKRQLTVEESERRAAQDRHLEEIARQASAQDMARENVHALIEALLQGRLPPDEERSSILSACAQTCETEGLDFSTVLQEMSIEGYPPIYWAIVNRSVASENDGVAPDSLVLALLDACRPLSPATLAAIRVACMMASDNVLLQRLFRSIPPLSHISTRDALLLGPANEEDRVDVEERRNGTGAWVALIKIPRFRLRMRVCQSVSVEFIASGRIWILAFSAVVETSPDGRSENKWFLSLELGEHSPPTSVNANLDSDSEDFLSRTIQLGHPMSELCPGRDKALKIRLDDGPIGPHLLNESSILVDSNKTLHARLSQTTIPVLVADSSSTSSHSRELTTPSPETVYSSVTIHPPRPPKPLPSQNSPPPTTSILHAGSPPSGRKKKRRNEVHVTLRRGGR
ncbi:hypothetical protein BJV74DRAFT_855820 [Russula compacta]|nr:hypothetical protein BJV74DRAFT_855820 [Russula compacta]